MAHSRSLVLTQYFLDNVFSCCPARARLFWNFFEKRELEITKPNTMFSYKKSKSCSFPYLTLLVTFPWLSSIPFQALLRKARVIYLMVQISRSSLSRAWENKLLGGSGFSEGKAFSVILENIKMWKNCLSHHLVFLSLFNLLYANTESRLYHFAEQMFQTAKRR